MIGKRVGKVGIAAQSRRDGAVTPDGYAVNTLQPPYQPSDIPPALGGDPDLADPLTDHLPPQDQETIGDLLSDQGISWAWYAEAFNKAFKDGRQPPRAPRTIIYNAKDGSPNFQPHHQPFNYFAKYAPGTQARKEHLKDGDDFLNELNKGS